MHRFRLLIVVALTTVAVLWTNGLVPRTVWSQEPVLAVHNGRLFDGTGAPPIDDGVVVIEGNRITQVGSASTVAIPSSATSIDADGGLIMPGVIDSHVHVGGSDRTTWQFVSGLLGERHRLWIPDQLGCGDSARPDPALAGEETYGATGQARNLLEALRQRNDEAGWPDRIVFVGHSLGGAVTLRILGSMELREAYPRIFERVDRAVLIAPLGFAVHRADHVRCAVGPDRSVSMRDRRRSRDPAARSSRAAGSCACSARGGRGLRLTASGRVCRPPGLVMRSHPDCGSVGG